MFGPTIKPKQPVQAEQCQGAELWRVLPSSDTKLLCEGRAGPLSVSPLHPAGHENLFLLFQGSLEKGRDCVRTITSWGRRACRAKPLTAFGLTGHFQPSLEGDRDLRGVAFSQFVWANGWGGEGLIPGSHRGKGCAQKGFTLPVAPRGGLASQLHAGLP